MLLETLAKLRRQFDAQDTRVLNRIITAYATGYGRVTPEITALVEYMEQLDKAGKLTPEAVKRSAVYRAVNRSIESELTDYQSYLRTEISAAADAAAKSGLSAGRLLMLAAIADALGVAIGDVPQDQVRRTQPSALMFLMDYLRREGPLFRKIDDLSGYHAKRIADGILEQVALGKNPRIIADWITDAYGMGLTDSLRMTRTVQLYSYRQANNAVQVANFEVLRGVVWCAELDDRVCMSCVALHGTVYPVGTIADDHYNGRCAMVPWVEGAPNPIEQSGEDWFNEQSDATQQAMMGQAKWDAWKDGQFELSQLTKVTTDDVYGSMRGETSLKDLVGD